MDYTRHIDHEAIGLRACKRVAIMGGTFDPIHNGHLAVAEAARRHLKADRVIFIPSGTPPHKNSAFVCAAEHRYLMTALAAASNPNFFVSRMEIDRPGASFTIDTITELREQCGKNTKLYFLIGADTVAHIPTWRDAELLMRLCAFSVVARPGYAKGETAKRMDELKRKYHADISLMEAPALAISSTELRMRARSGQPLKYLVPEEVERYISKHGLYSDGWGLSVNELARLDRLLRGWLSQKRYLHTLGVAETAVLLAERWGADKRSAHVAAMLHDAAKEIPPAEKLKLCDKYKLKIDDIMMKQPDLTHGPLSAELAKRKFDMKDKDILNAIAFHTTGRPDMSLLEKIVFVADASEPNRQGVDWLVSLRAMAYEDLDRAARMILEGAINLNKAKGRLVHPFSQAALDSLS